MGKENVCHIPEDQHQLIPLTWSESESTWTKRNVLCLYKDTDVKKRKTKTGLGHIEKEAHVLEAIGYVRGSAHRSHFQDLGKIDINVCSVSHVQNEVITKQKQLLMRKTDMIMGRGRRRDKLIDWD